MRQYRNVDDFTRKRISQSLRGRSFSYSHRKALSDALKAYWATIPYRQEDKTGNDGGAQDEKEM